MDLLRWGQKQTLPKCWQCGAQHPKAVECRLGVECPDCTERRGLACAGCGVRLDPFGKPGGNYAGVVGNDKNHGNYCIACWGQARAAFLAAKEGK
jgi:hypothetical protein